MIDFYEHIEEYIQGQLSPVDTLEFEKALAQDPKLVEAINNYPLAKKISAALIEAETRDVLKELKSKNITTSQRSWKWIGIAASIGLLIAMFFAIPYFKSNQIEYRPEQFYAQLYQSPAELGQRNAPDSMQLIDTAILLFDRGNIIESQNIFESLLILDANNLKCKYYLAHINLQQKNLGKAEMLFDACLKNEYKLDDARYHLMLIYLMQNRITAAWSTYEIMKDKDVLSTNNEKFLTNYFESQKK